MAKKCYQFCLIFSLYFYIHLPHIFKILQRQKTYSNRSITSGSSVIAEPFKEILCNIMQDVWY